jgi:hypothetical protein
MTLKSTFLGLVIASGTAFGASAATTAVVDYTDGVLDASVFGSSITLSTVPADRLANVQPFDGIAGETNGLAEIKDGLGVNPPDDEISFPGEAITVVFGGRGVRVIGLHFLDLFLAADGSEEELALVSFNGGPAVEFSAMALPVGKNGGYAHYTFAPIKVGSITFTAAPTNDARGVPDFALAAIDVAPIPLPAAGWMFVSALAGMGFLSRRRNAA